MRSGDTDNGALDGNAGNVFGGFHRFLNAANGFVELGDDALAEAARFGHAVPAITQAVVAEFGDEHARLGAAHVDGGNEIGRVVRHLILRSLLGDGRAGFLLTSGGDT